MSDKYDSLVVARLSFEGTDGGTTFTDDKGNTWSVDGNAQLDTAIKKYGASAGLFDGNADYISTTANGFWSLGSADFTIEAWVRLATTTPSGNFWSIIAQRANNSSADYSVSFITFQNSTIVGLVIRTGGLSSDNATVQTPNIPVGVWTHIAFTREGNTLKAWVNGELVAQTACSGSINNATSPVRIGAFDNPVWSGSYLNGSIDELRVTAGIARYKVGFRPPRGPYDKKKNVGVSSLY